MTGYRKESWFRLSMSRKRAFVLSCVVIVVINVIANFTILYGWSVREGRYELILVTNGELKDVTVWTRLYSFNSSTAILEQVPAGIQVKTFGTGEIEIYIPKLENATKAIIVLNHIKPTETIPPDSYKIYSREYPDPRGDFSNCTLIFSHFVVYGDSPLTEFQIYSNSIIGTSTNNEVDWLLAQSKTKTLTVARFGIGLLSFTIGMFLLWIFGILRVPVLTPLIAAGLVFVYVCLGVGNDFLASFDLSSFSRIILTLLSTFFHGDYGHLIGNISGFLICSSLIETWWKGIGRKAIILWYLSPLILSVAASALVAAGTSLPPIGSSFWIIGLAIANANYAFENRHRINLATSKWDFAALLFTGYVILSASYNYIAYALSYHFKEEEILNAVGHLAFFIFYYASLAVFKAVRHRWALKTSDDKDG